VTGPARRRLHIVLAHATDHGAAAVAENLHGALPSSQAMAWIQPEHLALTAWSHRVDAAGHASTRIELPDGRVIHDADIAVIWNRALTLPQARFLHSPAKDRAYAAAELQALVVSWLAGLRERALPNARLWPHLAPQPGAAQWRPLAQRRGLAIDAAADGAQVRQVLVAGSHAVGAADDLEAARCIDAAHELSLPVVAFGFTTSPLRPAQLVQVDAHPPLVDDRAQLREVAALLRRVGSGAAP
jgi:hypothetical protein